LEAAVFEKPLFFGPHYRKFNEAVELVQRGAACSITHADEMVQKLRCFKNDPSCYQAICETCKTYITQNLGATNKIWEVFTPFLVFV